MRTIVKGLITGIAVLAAAISAQPRDASAQAKPKVSFVYVGPIGDRTTEDGESRA